MDHGLVDNWHNWLLCHVRIGKDHSWADHYSREGMSCNWWKALDFLSNTQIVLDHCTRTHLPMEYKMRYSLDHSSFRNTALWSSGQIPHQICCRFQCSSLLQWRLLQVQAQDQWESDWWVLQSHLSGQLCLRHQWKTVPFPKWGINCDEIVNIITLRLVH